MNKISRSAARAKAVDSILGSLRIEKLTPSDSVTRGLRDCLTGTETTKHLLAEVINQHVKVRRD